MTALRRDRRAPTHRTGKPLSTLVGLSMRTSQPFGIDAAGSTGRQLRAMRRFVASLQN